MKALTALSLILTLGVMLGTAACGSIAPPEPTPTPIELIQPDPPPTPAPSATPEPTATPYVINAMIDTRHYGKAVASVEERVFLSDVVVKARFVSADSGLLQFRAIQYLKGTGTTRFSVRAETAGRATQWDGQDAILFLTRRAATDADYDFTDTTAWNYMAGTDVESELATTSTEYTGVLPEGYTVNSRNPVWLPVKPSSTGTARTASQSAGGIVTEYAADGTPRTTTEQAIRQTIEWLATPQQGAGASLTRNIGYRNAPVTVGARERDLCIRSSLSVIRYERDYEAHHGKSRPRGAKTYDIGPSINWGGYELSSTLTSSNYGPYRLGSETYDKRAIIGGDAYLFRLETIDDDRNAANGYTVEFTLRRPLPAGSYRFEYDSVFYLWSLCDFDPSLLNADLTVRVTAPEGTIHEALFDPATTTAGVGYLGGPATSTGVLEPAAFSTGSGRTTITGLKWEGGSVVLALSPFASLGDHQLEFIDLDGSTPFALRAPDATADSAAGTLTWAVADRPWSAGDLLMLRIGPAPDSAPAPLDVSVSLSDDALTISWNAVADASLYRVQRRTDGASEWTSLSAATTTQALSPEGGLSCGATYEFRLQARGDGETYLASWGLPSESVSHTTAACNLPPAFATSTYAFSVSEDAATSTTVATVSATDPDGDAVSYSITAGNDGDAFSIDGGGSIGVAAPLDYEAVSSYTLTVQAVDGRGGAATSTVNVAVTDVAEIPPPAPRNLSATSTANSVTLSWDVPDDPSITGYRILRRRPLEGERTLLVHMADTGSTETTYTDTDVAPGTQYAYRVKAINAAGPGAVSNFVNLTTPSQP